MDEGSVTGRRAERRRIDHVVVAVRDLHEAGAFYERLGFQVGTVNEHPWGTVNRLIQFGSSFLELISTGDNAHLIVPHEPRRFSFGAFVRDYLRERQGMTMLVLSSDDAHRDAELFRESGIGGFETFFFERTGVKPNGETTRVAFSLAFATDRNAPSAGFFACQQHTPENFWNSRFQDHANASRNITTVRLTASMPEQHLDFFTAFTGEESRRDGTGNYDFRLVGGRVEVCRDVHARQALLTWFTVEVDDVEALAKRLTQEAIPHTAFENGLTISERYAFGVGIRFERNLARRTIRLTFR